jgi:hypothetical protein
MARFNKYEHSTFSHIFDRDARIVVTQVPEQRSRENPNPDRLAYGRYVDEDPGVVRACLDEELVTLPENVPPPKPRRDYRNNRRRG